MTEISEDEIKELYAMFGLAYFQSESLHRGLCILYTFMGFAKKEHIVQPRIEERMSYAFSQTLGQIISQTNELWIPGLIEELKMANKKRVQLAHYFWFEKAHLMQKHDGVQELVQELNEACTVFSKLDDEIMKVVESKKIEFGIPDELIENEMNKILSGNGESFEPFSKENKIKRVENIIYAWDMPWKDNKKALILENEAGILFQLSDVGLCISLRKKEEAVWSISPIQKYLPALIETRPPCRGPWNYDLRLNDRTILAVGFIEEKGIYTLKIKGI
jgi:hypothetical protein